MRIAAGPHRVTASDGTEIHLDQPASRELADLLVQTIRHAGLTPRDVEAIILHPEQPAEIERCRTRLTIGDTDFPVSETMDPQIRTIRFDLTDEP